MLKKQVPKGSILTWGKNNGKLSQGAVHKAFCLFKGNILIKKNWSLYLPFFSNSEQLLFVANVIFCNNNRMDLQ